MDGIFNLIGHLDIEVSSDDEGWGSFSGSLTDFACAKLNEWMRLQESHVRVISIESSTRHDQVCLSTSNPAMWYGRDSVRLSVWYERQVMAR